MIKRSIFITGTDTGVGKTFATCALATLLQERGVKVGVMKPFQCAGSDAFDLKKNLGLDDAIENINPYFASEPLSPHIAFRREKIKISVEYVKDCLARLQKKYDVVLVEGAGGLLVPIKESYFMIDLARDFDLDVVIVARLGLGTINHTLLTIEQARSCGLSVCGVIFNEPTPSKRKIPEKTNPLAVRKYGSVNILGTIPYFKDTSRQKILKCLKGKIALDKILQQEERLNMQELVRDDKTYLWHPFTQMKDWIKDEPLIIEEAKGCYLKSTEGRWYIDGISSLWVNVHGHCHPKINGAIARQAQKVAHSTLLGLANVPSIELARRLVAIAPKSLTKVFYSDSGSTAVEIAVKIAYQYWQNIGKKKKKMIVHFAHSYHGDTLGSVSVGGIDLFHKVYHDLIFQAVKWPTPFPSAFGATKDFSRSFFISLRKFEQYLKKEHYRTAAVIVEPLVQGAAGMVVWPQGALKKLSELCRAYDVLLITDEVATGFGRTGTMFACEQEKVCPDILCLAKGLTAGYLPLAATLTSERIYQGFLFDYKEQKTFFHGHTYTGNPLACAAALANLEIFAKEKTIQKLQLKIKFLTKELRSLKNLSHVGNIRQKGFMVGVDLVKDKARHLEYHWEEKMGVKVCARVRHYGVILRPLGNTIVLMPPLAISKRDLKKIIVATTRAIKDVTEHASF